MQYVWKPVVLGRLVLGRLGKTSRWKSMRLVAIKCCMTWEYKVVIIVENEYYGIAIN